MCFLVINKKNIPLDLIIMIVMLIFILPTLLFLFPPLVKTYEQMYFITCTSGTIVTATNFYLGYHFGKITWRR